VTSSLDRFKKELAKLVETGGFLLNVMQAECHPTEFLKAAKIAKVSDAAAFIKGLPSFSHTYHSWYSEAKAVVKQVLPDRLADFGSHYQKPKARKNISYENSESRTTCKASTSLGATTRKK